MEPKNFTNYLLYINIYMITLIMAYFFFFNTDYKRSKVKILILLYVCSMNIFQCYLSVLCRKIEQH